MNTIILPIHGGMELRIRKATTPEIVHRELYQKLAVGCEVMRERRRLAPAEEAAKEGLKNR